MTILAFAPEAELRPLMPEDAEAVFAAVAHSRDSLAVWVRTPASAQDAVDTAQQIATTRLRLAGSKGELWGLWWRGAFAGELLLAVDARERSATIGYWLDERARGHGLMVRAVGAAIAHAFGPLGLHRIEIGCGVENAASRAIPEKLGFTREGTRREAQRMPDGRYVSLVIYGLLESEWSPTP
jgi:ribosomal-protein-serine acetyltransferase